MADAPKQNALMKFGPIGAPALGALLMILFVVVALMLGDTDGPKRRIDDAVSKINSRIADPKISEPAPEFKAAGLSGANKNFGVGTGGKILAKLDKEHLLLDFPVQVKVMLDAPQGKPDFPGCDKDSDGKLTRDEYAQSEKYGASIKFKTLNTDNDKNYLSRAEYDAIPDETIRAFDWLDQFGATNNTDDGDDRISKAEYEKSGKEDFDEKDLDKDGFISRKEYGGKPPAAKADLDAPIDVVAVANSKGFVITVTWTAPNLKDVPSDLGYWVLRKSPKDLEDRKLRYNTVDLPAARKKEEAWKKEFDTWRKVSGNDKKSEKDYEKETGKYKPLTPPKPSEWELLNTTPITELRFEDLTFHPEYTYTYAIRATTKAELKTGTKTDETFAEGYRTSAPCEMAGRPVVVYNRIDMAWAAKVDETTARIKLRKFHAIGGTWRPVEVTIEVKQGEDVGGLWDAAGMKGRGYTVVVFDAEGKASSDFLKALEASREKIDFHTGWAFNRFVGSDVELGQKGGAQRFVLPKDTKEPAKEAPMDPSGMANPIAIRLSSAEKGGDKARLEITRWKQVGAKWYRIVAYHDMRKGECVGYTKEQIATLKTGEMIFFFDDGGIEIKEEAKINQLTLRDISMETGLTYGGIDKRTVDFGAGKMDLWGVYYVDK